MPTYFKNIPMSFLHDKNHVFVAIFVIKKSGIKFGHKNQAYEKSRDVYIRLTSIPAQSNSKFPVN